MDGLDVSAGARILQSEIYGDWYRDPWDWFEIRRLIADPEDFPIAQHLKKDAEFGMKLTTPPAFSLMEIPKSGYAVRPAVLMDPTSRLLYASAIAPNLRKLHSALPGWCYGWRSRDDSSFAANADEWNTYSNAMVAAEGDYALNADVASFFGSVDVSLLSEQMASRLGKVNGLGILAGIIDSHDKLATRSGLPQRSFVSAAIAQVYMAGVDDTLIQFDKRHPANKVFRWMDDICAIGKEPDLFRLHLELEQRAQQAGMTLNSSKSLIVPMDDFKNTPFVEGVAELSLKRYRGPASGSKSRWSPDPTRLGELEEEIISSPLDAPTILINGVLGGLVDARRFDKVEEWKEIVRRIPQSAASLGRFLRAALREESSEVTAESVSEFFTEFIGSEWNIHAWVSSQISLSIPITVLSGSTLDIFSSWLQSSNDVQQVAIAGFALASRRPSDCRDIVRSRVDQEFDPFLLRVLALSLVVANDDRQLVTSILRRDPRTHLVLSALRKQNWRVRSPRDYSGMEQ